MKIKLIRLNYDMEVKVNKFISESPDLPEIFKLVGNDFRKTVKAYDDYSNGINLPEGFVAYTIFYALDMDTNDIVGQISVRHELNDYLKFRGGHIGYYVCPNQRRKRAGTEMLSEILGFCKELKSNKVLITCDETNIGSNKIIINNHGVLDTTDIDPNGVKFNRYWINLN
ncbi:MAG: GNAT family N-acetyltransferase [Romboutsia sp.]